MGRCTLCSFVLDSSGHFSSRRNNIPIKFCIFIVSGDAQIPVSVTTIFEYIIFINQDNCLEWVVTINSVSVYIGSSTFLYGIIMKNLVSTKPYNFDQTSVYLKSVAFLPITFLEQKSFLKFFIHVRDYVLRRFCLSGTNYQINLLLDLLSKAQLTHAITIFCWFKHMVHGKGYLKILMISDKVSG